MYVFIFWVDSCNERQVCILAGLGPLYRIFLWLLCVEIPTIDVWNIMKRRWKIVLILVVSRQRNNNFISILCSILQMMWGSTSVYHRNMISVAYGSLCWQAICHIEMQASEARIFHFLGRANGKSSWFVCSVGYRLITLYDDVYWSVHLSGSVGDSNFNVLPFLFFLYFFLVPLPCLVSLL